MSNADSEIVAQPTENYFFPSNYESNKRENSYTASARIGPCTNSSFEEHATTTSDLDNEYESDEYEGVVTDGIVRIDSAKWTLLRSKQYHENPQELVGGVVAQEEGVEEDDEFRLEREPVQTATKRRFYQNRKFLCVLSLLIILVVSSILLIRGVERTTPVATAAAPGPTKKAFATTQELYHAVDRWLANKKMTELAAVYGFPIGEWDVSRITDFSYLFDACKGCDPPGRNLAAAEFNEEISNWNVSSAKNMSHMFRSASNFNGDLSRWDVSHVTNMSWMFSRASNFQSDLSDWDVSSVVDMRAMFIQASLFDGDVSRWDVSQVKYMSYMFVRASSFNANVSNWNLSSAIDMTMMFYGASAYNQDLCSWGSHLQAKTSMIGAFGASGCPDQNDPDFTTSPPGPFCYACM